MLYHLSVNVNDKQIDNEAILKYNIIQAANNNDAASSSPCATSIASTTSSVIIPSIITIATGSPVLIN